MSRWNACYQSERLLPRWIGNPLIEAMPRLGTEAEITEELVYLPDFVRSEASELPIELVDSDIAQTLSELYIPPSIAPKLAGKIYGLMRTSYSSRSPLDPRVRSEVYDTKSCLAAQKIRRDTFDRVVFLEGLSGLGKTRLIRTILGAMPQVLVHTSYRGTPFVESQVLWLSIDAPINGSLKGLMLSLLVALDEALGLQGPDALAEQYEGDGADQMLSAFCRAAKNYHLGALHIDDFQRVAESKSGRLAVLHFIIRLVNTVRCPLILSGTKETLEIFNTAEQTLRSKQFVSNSGAKFEASRRVFSGGHYILERPRSYKDAFFRLLVDASLRYQWTKGMMPRSEETYRDLYVQSVGITSVHLFLHHHAQLRVIGRRKSEATVEDYKQVNVTMLSRLQPALDVVRRLTEINPMEADRLFEDKVPAICKEEGSLTTQSQSGA